MTGTVMFMHFLAEAAATRDAATAAVAKDFMLLSMCRGTNQKARVR